MALPAIFVSSSSLLGGSVRVKLSTAPLLQRLSKTTLVLRGRAVSADDLSASLPPAISSWARRGLVTEGGLPIPYFRRVLEGHDHRDRGDSRGCSRSWYCERFFTLSRELLMRYRRPLAPQRTTTRTGCYKHETSRRRTIGACVVRGRCLIYEHSLLSPFRVTSPPEFVASD